MSWKLVIIVIVVGIIYFQFIRYISTKISYNSGKEKRESGQKERVIVTEYTSGIKQIKVFETFEYWRKIFDNTIDKFWFHHRRNYFWNKLPQILLWMVIYVGIGGAIIFINLQYPGEFLDLLPLLGAFATGIFLVLPKIAQFGQFRMQFMHHMPNVETVQDVLKEEKYSKMKNGTKVFSDFKIGIKFKNVSFSHKERDVLLKNIDLLIKKDKTTALVGPSGVGKSTIVNLILRLFDVDEGGVFVDDTNIMEFDIFTFLDKVGFVSQDTFIFNGTVSENIAFGGDYIEEEIIDAAKKANAHDFIEKLPSGYDTIVGDRGMRLSGGEQQRVAIARAIIRKPKIILLDEATSSLDTVSEKMLQNAIEEISKNCTTFIIAHRLTTIKNADVIHVLDKGKIIESGTHEQLKRKKGKYWELYNNQKG
jgi:ABC-type multidrug transport system fused ATPase/permease subunit